MLKELKEQVLISNLMLTQHQLVMYTWGNVSGIDRDKGLVVIKPSGVDYDVMDVEDMVVVDMRGKVVEGKWKPSSDLPTHLELYNAFMDIGGIAHTHSRWATTFAQSRMGIPPFGTLHADNFYGEIPCTRRMTAEEIATKYEENIGKTIVELFHSRKVSPVQMPAVLVQANGPYAWGKDPEEAVRNAVLLEDVAKLAWQNMLMEGTRKLPMQQVLLDKHYLRRNGKNAYYGQPTADLKK